MGQKYYEKRTVFSLADDRVEQGLRSILHRYRLKNSAQLMSCVKAEVAVLGFPPLTVRTVSGCGRKATLSLNCLSVTLPLSTVNETVNTRTP